MSNIVLNEKRKVLEDYKQRLISDLQYFQRRANEAHSKSNQITRTDGDSSDSDIDMTCNIDLGPSVSELKQQQSRLKTCLQATCELTGVQVLQSQVELVVDDPVFEGEPVKEEGTWYEVVAECKMDLVQFLITFFVHKPKRKFAPLRYRDMKLSASKTAHETELATCVTMPQRPGDAVDLVRQYSVAHRSRRSSLARLADKFANTLKMSPRTEGGYSLKCLDVLEMCWMIKYSRSKAAFNHSLKFDIDEMDPKYIQLIKQYYQQLNPTIGTEKRTQLLEKILHICVESKGAEAEMYDSK